MTINERRRTRFFGQRLLPFRFQLKFSLAVFIVLAFAAVVSWYFSNRVLQQSVEAGEALATLSFSPVKILNTLLFQTTIISFAITLILAIFFSHFIAGPIYRFERILEEMRDGNLNLYVRLRDKDEFKDTAELFNQALTSLRQRTLKERTQVQDSILKMRNLAEDLEVSGNINESKQLIELIKEIESLPPQIKI